MFLVVVRDFARHLRGEAITAADEIAHALAHHSEKVVRVDSDTPAATASPEPSKDHSAEA